VKINDNRAFCVQMVPLLKRIESKNFSEPLVKTAGNIMTSLRHGKNDSRSGVISLCCNLILNSDLVAVVRETLYKLISLSTDFCICADHTFDL